MKNLLEEMLKEEGDENWEADSDHYGDTRSILINAFFPYGYSISSEKVDSSSGDRVIIFVKGDEEIETRISRTKGNLDYDREPGDG